MKVLGAILPPTAAVHGVRALGNGSMQDALHNKANPAYAVNPAADLQR